MTTVAARDIARRNNDDVIESLMTGDYETSKARSSKALEMIQKSLPKQQQQQQQTSPSLPPQDEDHDDTSVASPNKRRLRSIPIPMPAGSKNHHTTCTIIDIFNGAISFDLEHTTRKHTTTDANTSDRYSQDDDDDDDAHVLAAVILYNTGLCHHLQSMQQQHQSYMLLQKALNFYSMACNFLTSSGMMTKTTTTPMMMDDEEEDDDDHNMITTISLLLLALMNNMAHIHFSCMELERAWDCLDTMREEFEYNMFDDDIIDDVLTDEEFIFFSMNSTLVLPRDSFVASPAA